jgi:hypothetical protein
MLSPPLWNSSTPRSQEPDVANIDRLRQWQDERMARKLRGEYESAVLHLNEVVCRVIFTTELLANDLVGERKLGRSHSPLSRAHRGCHQYTDFVFTFSHQSPLSFAFHAYNTETGSPRHPSNIPQATVYRHFSVHRSSARDQQRCAGCSRRPRSRLQDQGTRQSLDKFKHGGWKWGGKCGE